MTDPPAPEKLVGHISRAPSTGHSGCGVLIGAIFLALGVGGVLLGFGVIHFRHDVKPFVPAGIAVGVLGLHLILAPAIRALFRAGKHKPRHAQVEPWWADYAWSTRELAADQRSGCGTVYGSMLFGAIVGTLTWLVFTLDSWSGCWGIGLMLLDAVAVTWFIAGIYQLLRRLKYGAPSLRIGAFPFLLGKKLDAVMKSGRRLDAVRTLTATLRCIEERTEGKNTRACFVLWSRAVTFDQLKRVMRQGRDLPLMFELPEQPALGTRLADAYPRYWELEIAGEAPGVDFKATFLVPVYAPLSPGS